MDQPTVPNENAACEPIAITGMGIRSAIGHRVSDVVDRLRSARPSARPITRFCVEPFHTKFAAEVDLDDESNLPFPRREQWDRGTLMAILAAEDALTQSRVLSSDRHETRVGVSTGVSGSGQFQTARAGLQRDLILNQKTAEVILRRNIPSYQSEQLAEHFGLQGPQTAVASASAGSGIAIGIGMRWLQSGRCDAVLTGGSECLSVLNIIGFDVLGITASEQCHPFSRSDGMMMGEGAGYLVLERESDALRRGAKVLGYLDGFAISADAFDPVLFDPTGNGQHRAMRRALSGAESNPGDVDWIRASGSGGRDQDSAEKLAIGETFPNVVPPISSLEPFFGHCNGAGPAIGLIAATACMQERVLPPTLGFASASKPPQGFDFVPNRSRKQEINRTLCNSAAFGGTNVAILCSREVHHRATHPCDDVLITGIGSLASLCHGGRETFSRYREPETGIAVHDRFDMPKGTAKISGLVDKINPRKVLPHIKLRGVDRLAKFAAMASRLAYRDADLEPEKCDPDRLGVVAGLAYASGDNLQRLMGEIYRDYHRPTVGKVMLRNGRFIVTSQLSHWFGIQGYNSTLACGEVSGLHALTTAADQLRHDPQLDAVLVVAADEVSEMFTRLYGEMDQLVREDGHMVPHSDQSTGRVMGEGGIALILERASFAERRGAKPLARISGQAMSFQKELESSTLCTTVRHALADASVDSSQVGPVAGVGSGDWHQDRLERESVETCFHSEQPTISLSGHTGFMESSSSLFSVAGILTALSGQAPATLRVNHLGHAWASTNETPTVDQRPRHGIVIGRGRAGHQVAVTLSAP